MFFLSNKYRTNVRIVTLKDCGANMLSSQKGCMLHSLPRSKAKSLKANALSYARFYGTDSYYLSALQTFGGKTLYVATTNTNQREIVFCTK